MAGLSDAIYSQQLPTTNSGFSFPGEKLYHVNGSPRELFTQKIVVDLTNQKLNEDRVL